MIGIDPDISKSGVAVKQGKKITELRLMRYFELFDWLQTIKLAHGDDVTVYVEAGWLNAPSNFHKWNGQSKTVGERIAKNVGANHEAGRKIVEMLEYLDINHRLVRPAHSKMKPELFKQITGIDTKNQEKIDAGVLIL